MFSTRLVGDGDKLRIWLKNLSLWSIILRQRNEKIFQASAYWLDSILKNVLEFSSYNR